MACLTPFYMNDPKTLQPMALPCGKCASCLKRRVSGWSFRLQNEEKYADSAYFLTLTYDTDHVPITKNGFMTFQKSHFQSFMKRLRKQHKLPNQKPIKYYLAAEYGSIRKRPHYHIIIYNLQLSVLIGSKYEGMVLRRSLSLDGTFEFQSNKFWPYGHFTLGTVSAASIGYTLEYITMSKTVPEHRHDDRIQEFSLMSKGLGATYRDTAKSWHRKSLLSRYYLPLQDGKRAAMPRYYKDSFYTKSERQFLGKQLKQPELTEPERLQQVEADMIWLKRKKKKKGF